MTCMIQPAVYDTVELLDEHHTADYILPAGTRGTVIYQYTDQLYGVEFTSSSSRKPFEVVLYTQQLAVIWQASRSQEVPLRAQLDQIIDHLPEPAQAQLLKAARKLNARLLATMFEEGKQAVPTG